MPPHPPPPPVPTCPDEVRSPQLVESVSQGERGVEKSLKFCGIGLINLELLKRNYYDNGR